MYLSLAEVVTFLTSIWEVLIEISAKVLTILMGGGGGGFYVDLL
jgi:hypothetical protein